MTANYHTHTWRCNHASGVEREYIENAIAMGMTTLGFSDHAPYVFEGDYYSNFRMRPEQQEDYVTTLLALKEEYRGRIDIKIGYEAEYYPKYFDAFLKRITRYPVDYLIMGQHFVENEIGARHTGTKKADEAQLRQFVDQCCEGFRTGVFSYAAHPDIYHHDEDPAVFDREYRRLIACAIECEIPLEINLLGIRGHRNYPHERFFALCGEMGAAVCLGCDAHAPKDILDETAPAVAKDWIERYGLRVVENPILRPVPTSLK